MKKITAKRKQVAVKKKDSFAHALESVRKGVAEHLVELAGLEDQEVLAALDNLNLKKEESQLIRLALLGVAWKKRDAGLPLLAAALRHQNSTLAQEAAAALGIVESRSAASLLAEAIKDPALVHLHKPARKSLYLLQTKGITPESEPDLEKTVAKQLSKPGLRVAHKVLMSHVDGVGARSIICAVLGGSRGLDVTFLLLNDQVGIKDCWTVQFGKQKFAREAKYWTREEKGDSDYCTFAEVDPDYIRFLLSKYYRLNMKSGFTPPAHLHTFRRVLGEPVKEYSKHPVYQLLDEAQIRASLRELAADSILLMDEQEIEGWFFGLEEVEGEARDLLKLLPDQPADEPAGFEALFKKCRRKIAARLLAGIHLERWTARLEDTAYYFASRNNTDSAALCLAVVMALNEGMEPLKIPFFSEMVNYSLRLAVNALKDGIRPEDVAYDPHRPVR